jgi:bifunctional non-homologous end joining protein LigD
MIQESVTLYYREGSSDKVYQAAIEQSGEGFIVTFAYGRRGSTLQTGTKTSSPVPYASAKSIYDKLVQEKTAKGYTPGESGTPYQHSENQQRATGVLPQLCNPIEADEVKTYLADCVYWLQEKLDGKRVMIQKTSAGITGINRKGLIISLPSSIIKSAADIPSAYIMDGECVGDVYHAFDLLMLNTEDLRTQQYQHRHLALMNLLASAQHPHIEFVEAVVKQTDKSRLYLKLRGARKEGVVFKRSDALYTPGHGDSWRKFKFTTTGSFIVSTNNSQRSVGLEVFDGKARVQVGNVTIPVNKAIPALGSIIEVRYLYAFRGGSLFQPVFLSVRDDLDVNDCRINQLKYKADDGDEES